MPRLEFADGFSLYYETYGPDIATSTVSPLLLAHGAGGNAAVWWQNIQAFSDRYPVITFDHRAFGRSPDILDGPGRIAFGADARALLKHLGVSKVHFVAHSMGGRTAFGLFSREPEMIKSLIYSGTNGGCVDESYRVLKSQLEQDGTLTGSLLQRAMAPDFAQTNPERQFLYRQLRGLNPKRSKDFLAPTERMINYKGTTAQRLSESQLPILWICGDYDRVVHPDLIQISHQLTPGSQYVGVPAAGHSAYFENPSVWNSSVRAFVDRVELDC
ncbi:MAG: alpha/beta hydrolase [Chloroflexota bacterium]|nr:alpha/beta hydrolase [Chloroflexota bacterium]